MGGAVFPLPGGSDGKASNYNAGDPGSPTVSLTHQEVSISLLTFSIRGQTDWKPQSQKTNQTDHMDHSYI